MVFPPEIYAEILSHITDNKSLRPLLLTSRLLNQEAEKKLYCKPKPLSRQVHSLLLHLPTCSRVAHYVRSLRIDIEAALNSLNNLTALTLRHNYTSLTTKPTYLSSLIPTVPFQLREFKTDSPINCHLKSFLRSQPEIRHLKLSGYRFRPQVSESDLVLSREDLPALTALDYSLPTPLYSLFPELFATNLSLNVLITIPLPSSVRALRTLNHRLLASLPTICPNLRFLDTSYREYNDFGRLACLQKLKIWFFKGVPNAADVVLGIYTSHNTLKSVELCQHNLYPDQVIVYRTCERFNPETLAAEPVSEICIENLSFHKREWATWQG